MIKNTNSVNLCQNSDLCQNNVFSQNCRDVKNEGFERNAFLFLSFYVAARETKRKQNGKWPTNIKIVFLKVGIQT